MSDLNMRDPRVSLPGGLKEGPAQVPNHHHNSTASEADVLALSEYAWRSDVLVLVAVQHRNGRWRREPFLSLTGARNRYLKARRNGLRAVMITAELRVTHGHAKALEHLQNLEVQSGGGDDE